MSCCVKFRGALNWSLYCVIFYFYFWIEFLYLSYLARAVVIRSEFVFSYGRGMILNGREFNV